MNTVRKTAIYLLTTGFLILAISCGEEKKEAITDKEEPSKSEIQNEIADSSSIRFIGFNNYTFHELKPGDELIISTEEEEVTYQLIIRRVQESMPGITSITADIQNQENGLATLMLREKMLSGILDLHKEDVRYRIGYDAMKDSYYLIEVFPERKDRLEGSEPRIPPNQKQQ